MSYLSQRLRLHFAGQFQATVSTVNNDVTHFNNATFLPSYQQRMTGNAPDELNGWWNPAGDGVWRLLGCAITSAFMADGTAASPTDAVLTLSVADSDNTAPAKLVDLDPQQQMVSMIFGLKIRLANATGQTLMRGEFAPAAFTDLWSKIQGSQGGDMALGTMWQSVITVTEWGNLSASPFLQALQAAAEANGHLLSIKFNVDCYSMNWPTNPPTPGDNQFCRGRIVGTIGTAATAEPRHFVLGRQLLALQSDSTGNPYINYCAAVVDPAAGVIRLDLGNALPVDSSGNQLDIGSLSLVVSPPGAAGPTAIGTIPYLIAGWYRQTAGIVEVPLPAGLASVVANNPLGLLASQRPAGVLTGENPPTTADGVNYPGGRYVRADLFVFRLGPGETAPVNFYATAYGQPCAGQVIDLQLNPAGLGWQAGEPDVGTPAGGLLFPASVTTGADGRAVVTLTGGDTANARGYIDGQVYGVGYALADESPADPANSWNFISVLVFDAFAYPPGILPTWNDSFLPGTGLRHIFEQYANLYPVMSRFINLGDYQQVKAYASMLVVAFGLPVENPNYMPVTRDLSPGKRAAILAWLQNPLEGPPPPPPDAKRLQAAAPAPSPSPTVAAAAAAARGGKTAAMARRLSRR